MNNNSSRKSKEQLFLTGKVILLMVIIYLLYDKLNKQEDVFNQIYTNIKLSVSIDILWYMVVIILMPFNWALEALKWKLLVRKFEKISLSNSMKGVIAGLTMSFATPHGIGDYFGRILTIQKQGREALIGSLFISRATQMLATALFGLIGVQYLFGFWWVLSSILISLFGIAICWQVLIWLNRLDKFNKYVSLIGAYNLRELSVVQLLALARYFIFSIQFLIILILYIPGLDLGVGFGGTTYIFLAKSILPSLNFLSDLGIREYAAIQYFEKFNVQIIPVVCASLSLWFINIFIPTIIGIPSMLSLKWRIT